jgi:hypothetical protein
LAWLGLAWLGLAWLGLAWLGLEERLAANGWPLRRYESRSARSTATDVWYADSMLICAMTSSVAGSSTPFRDFRSLAGDNDWYDNFYVHGDVHFSKFGNQVIADIIKATLK